MARGNQRDHAREKNLKKQQDKLRSQAKVRIFFGDAIILVNSLDLMNWLLTSSLIHFRLIEPTIWTYNNNIRYRI